MIMTYPGEVWFDRQLAFSASFCWANSEPGEYRWPLKKKNYTVLQSMFPSARPNWLLIILTDHSLFSTVQVYFIIFIVSYHSPLSQHQFKLFFVQHKTWLPISIISVSKVWGLLGCGAAYWAEWHPWDLNPHDISPSQRSSYFTTRAAHCIWNHHQ